MSDGVKNVVIYATCQGRMLCDVFNASSQFSSQYRIIDQVQNYELIRTGRSFLTYLNHLENLKQADVFIYQPIADIYGDNATDVLKSYLKPDAVAISIPYVYNSSFWPIVPTSNIDVSDDWMVPMMSVIKNAEVIRELYKTLSLDEILREFSQGNIDFQYIKRFNNDITILQEKENVTDVKAAQFILDNYKRMILFNGPSHPTYDVICHMGNQILRILGIDDVVEYVDQPWYYPSLEPLPFTKCAKQAFGFEFESQSEEFYFPLIRKMLSR